jgi:hypothetical protein
MRITKISPQPDWVLSIFADDGRMGNFDVRPYLKYEVFEALKDQTEFLKVFNGGYFIEWEWAQIYPLTRLKPGGRWLPKQSLSKSHL